MQNQCCTNKMKRENLQKRINVRVKLTKKLHILIPLDSTAFSFNTTYNLNRALLQAYNEIPRCHGWYTKMLGKRIQSRQKLKKKKKQV